MGRGADVAEQQHAAEQGREVFAIPGSIHSPLARGCHALIKTGVTVHKATAPFSVGGKQYPANSYVVKASQAFRAHVLDTFEPQDHPNDLQYPGGPPIAPYDIAGWTLAMQMAVRFEREAAEQREPGLLLARLDHGEALLVARLEQEVHLVGDVGGGFGTKAFCYQEYPLAAIAAKRKRNVEWIRSSVKESAAITASKALELGVIDLIANDVPDLLKQIDGREVNGKKLIVFGGGDTNRTLTLTPATMISSPCRGAKVPGRFGSVHPTRREPTSPIQA